MRKRNECLDSDNRKKVSNTVEVARWSLKVCWTPVVVAPEVVPGKCPVLDSLYPKQPVLLCITREEQSQSTDFWVCFLTISIQNPT